MLPEAVENQGVAEIESSEPGVLSLSWADELRRISGAVSKTALRAAPGQ